VKIEVVNEIRRIQNLLRPARYLTHLGGLVSMLHNSLLLTLLLVLASFCGLVKMFRSGSTSLSRESFDRTFFADNRKITQKFKVYGWRLVKFSVSV
jgi:hypothetical protein